VEIDEYDHHVQEPVDAGTFVVEIEGEKGDPHDPPPFLRLQQAVNGHKTQENEQKEPTGEEDRGLPVVFKQVQDLVDVEWEHLVRISKAAKLDAFDFFLKFQLLLIYFSKKDILLVLQKVFTNMKNLSLKLQDAIFSETEMLAGVLKKNRNAYMNEALAFYNRYQRRRLLADQLRLESAMVADSSSEVLTEFELLEDLISEN
jgi:predicted transcriptional regulator